MSTERTSGHPVHCQINKAIDTLPSVTAAPAWTDDDAIQGAIPITTQVTVWKHKEIMTEPYLAYLQDTDLSAIGTSNSQHWLKLQVTCVYMEALKKLKDIQKDFAPDTICLQYLNE